MHHPLRLCLALIAAFAVAPAAATTFAVTTVADSGPGSLRQAIIDANTATTTGGMLCAPHNIVFAVPGSGVRTIRPLSPLPRIEIGIEIDGYSQAGSSPNTQLQGSNAVLLIEIDGSSAGPGDAFEVGTGIPSGRPCAGNFSVFQGLVINRWQGAAILVGESTCPVGLTCAVGGVRISGNYIGTDASGSIALGNGATLARAALVFARRTTGNIIGQQVFEDGGATTPTPSARNVISGNASHGIHLLSDIAGVTSSNHRIRNNYVGLNAQGTAILANGGDGIRLDGGSESIRIDENLVSGNAGIGVRILDGHRGSTRLLANGVGIGVDGVPAGNTGDGIRVAAPLAAVTVVRGYAFLTGTSAAVSFNGGAGLFVENNAFVDVTGGSIANNAALEIDLAPAGVTPNDPGDIDSGPNTLLNVPTLISATLDVGTGTGTIVGSLDARPSTGGYEVHYYVSESCDPSGSGGGRTPLTQGSVPVISTGITTDAAGFASFVRSTSSLPVGRFLTALTRRFVPGPAGPDVLVVSEFSACRAIVGLSPLIFSDGFEL